MADEDRQARVLEALKALSATPEERAEQAAERAAEGLPATLTLAEQRIDAIIDQMLQGLWVAGVTERTFQKQWGLSESRVRHLATEASRVIRRYMREDEASRRDALNEGLVALDRIARKAEKIGNPGGLRVAKDARVDKLTFMGLKPAQKHIIRKDEMSDWTDGELAEFAATGKRPPGKE